MLDGSQSSVNARGGQSVCREWLFGPAAPRPGHRGRAFSTRGAVQGGAREEQEAAQQACGGGDGSSSGTRLREAWAGSGLAGLV